MEELAKLFLRRIQKIFKDVFERNRLRSTHVST